LSREEIMREFKRNILECIGNTSLLALRNIAPQNSAHILLKLENENPTGSMKDRMALAMIEGAERRGALNIVFAAVIIAVAIYMLVHNLTAL